MNQSANSLSSLNVILAKIERAVINPIIALLFALAMIYFLWGVFTFVRSADNPEERSTGGKHIFWGAIGMGIMLGVYGIVSVVINTVGVPQQYQPTSIPVQH